MIDRIIILSPGVLAHSGANPRTAVLVRLLHGDSFL